jgi:hypothetical protein
MLQRPESRRCSFRPPAAAALLALVASVAGLAISSAPLSATVTTVFTCPPSDGDHDLVSNGFIIEGLAAVNVHTVTIDYTTDTDGMYLLSLTATSGSFGGPQVGTTQSQMVSLSSSGDTPVVWSFGDAAITSGSNIFFTHTASGAGNVMFNLSSSLCPGDEETVGVSDVDNGVSVAVTITQNTTPPPPACVANNTTLCIDDVPGDKRFQITSTFATSQAGGKAGNGQAISLVPVAVSEGGLFWFFSSSNPEMLIKVINGCTVNNHFWVFYSAGTNVGFQVHVKDMKTSHTANYQNTDLTEAPPLQDVNALICP